MFLAGAVFALLLVAIVGAISYALALIPGLSLVELLLLSYGFISQLFPLTVMMLLWPRGTRPGALWGLLTGGLITIVLNVFPTLAWGDIHPGIYGVVGNVIMMPIVSLRTPPMDASHVAKFSTTPAPHPTTQVSSS